MNALTGARFVLLLFFSLHDDVTGYAGEKSDLFPAPGVSWARKCRHEVYEPGAAIISPALCVADPDPGSGAFLTPGSGIGKKSGSRMNNPDHISVS